MRRAAVLLLAAILASAAAFVLWEPGPSTKRTFDRGRNGIWLGSRWYTGFDTRAGRPVSAREVDVLLDTLGRAGIRYAYVRAGRITAAGSLQALPAPLFFELQRRAPEVRFLPWLSADADDLPLTNATWRDGLVDALARLRDLGVDGVHLNLEPIRDGHPGYVDLLRALRTRLDKGFLISQASRRVAPFGASGALFDGRFWSEAFYRETMAACDQTVLMGYNTALDSAKLYRAYMQHQTTLLVEWAADLDGRRVLIGIPAYEGLSDLSDPQVENIRNAAAGVRAALEAHAATPEVFEGVAIYAYWLVDADEWRQFDTAWLGRRTP